MTLEELLIKYQHVFPENTEVLFSIKKKINSVYCEFSIEGSEMDAIHSEIGYDDPETAKALDYIFNVGFGDISYQYKNGINTISISMGFDIPVIKFLKSPMIQAIVFGLSGGLLLRLLLPDQAETISNELIMPVFSVLMDVLKGITEPVIFISLIAGICAVGSLQKMKEISKSILFSFFRLSTLMFVIGIAVCSPAFAHRGGGSGDFSLQQLLGIILGSIPTDMFKPFIDSNMIQIVLLAFAGGMILLSLGNKTAGIRNLVLELKTFFSGILDAFVTVLPFITFLSIVAVISTTRVSGTAGIWKIIVLIHGINIGFAVMMILYTSIRLKVPAKEVFRKISSTFFTAFSTGSGTAAIPSISRELSDNFGVESGFLNYWLPFSASFFSPSVLFSIIVYTFFALESQGVSLGMEGLLILYVLTMVMVVATPKIPGGIMATIAIIFSELGLNTDQMGIIMGANVIVLYFATGVGSMTKALCGALLAYQKGYCNEKILRKT